MNKHLICFDLDGTLLNKKEEISFLTSHVISTLFKKGHYVVLNTGRPLKCVFPYLEKLKMFNYPIICYNGGCIVYVNKNKQITKTIYEKLDHKLINSFLESVKTMLVYAAIYSLNERYHFNDDKVPSFLENSLDDTPVHIITKFNIQTDILMISLSVKKEDKELFEKALYSNKNKSISVLYWGDDDKYSYYDLQAPNVSKGLTMLKLANMLKINSENIIAYGDEINDISMLKLAKTGYLVLSDKAHELSEKYGFEITKKDSSHDGAIWNLIENHKDLF